ncbi:probable beta-galactosidase [Serendipita indica DSM 11827]|uniref:beta-galactosidase n=1 Tax=Serendipita indica (strain DSM 11827) TaxID=1109443 RepID=G4T7D6_SERID|nr:probable beta-galactosidase [Serendipita indica DSM 11827]
MSPWSKRPVQAALYNDGQHMSRDFRGILFTPTQSLLPWSLDQMPNLIRKKLLVSLLSLGLLNAVAQDGYQVPIGSPGFYHGNSTASVTFDQYSLFLDNSRTLFLSGEFHPFRLPSPKLWKDVLQKYKAAGLNGVSIYLHWGLTSPSQGVNRWTGHNDIVKFLQLAKEVGLLVIARPGPYINAESAGGGLPAWLANVPALARTNATAYRDAWHPYIKEFAQLSAPYQYPDGPLIAVQAENEFSSSQETGIPGLNEYMQDVLDTLRAGGLNKIPTTHNANWPRKLWVTGTGAVDLFGFDGYPALFDCVHPETWPETDTGLHANHLNTAPAVPLALYEWQGGAFDFWGSGAGYDNCYELTNEKFANVFYKNNIAGGMRLQNFYMADPVGAILEPRVSTLVMTTELCVQIGIRRRNMANYGMQALREDRTITPKFSEIKVQSYFLHASPAYMTSDWVGAGSQTTGASFSDSSNVYTTVWRDPQSGTSFYTVRQTTNTKLTTTEFNLHINSTALGNDFIVPTSGVMTLEGRESKVLVADYKFGNSKLLFATTEILTWQTFDGTDYIYLYTSPSQSIEVIVQPNGSATPNDYTPSGFTVKSGKNYTVISAPAKRTTSVSAVKLGKTVILISDKANALATWAPRIEAPASGLGHYTPSSNIAGVWVTGPYLVRTASLKQGTLALTGDLNSTVSINIWGPSSIRRVTWNGKQMSTSRNTKLNSITANLQYSLNANGISIPKLSQVKWKCIDSTPEKAVDFDDSKWTVANKTSTLRPHQPFAGKYVLYGGEYGFYSGDLVWRGYFDGKNATGIELSVQTGFSGAATVFLNGQFLASKQGSSQGWSGVDIQQINSTFPVNLLRSKKNVLTVYHDSTGLSADYNVDDEFKKPRGIRGYKLLSTNGTDFYKWTVVGNVGGANAPDDVRGPYNEGGWYYERIGAHLPGYDDSAWSTCSPLSGRDSPGVTAYRTTFNLNIPNGSDVPLAFDFELEPRNSTTAYRSLIWVNGWQFGRFFSDLGPQTSYPVPEGILNYQGKNEVVVTLWSLYGAAKMKKLELNKRAVISSSKTSNFGLVNAPDWKALRGRGSH